jgi:pimeloyl-ACP methyl ester carboxylesterase
MELVLLHAFPFDSRMWPADLHAITPDQHGRGREPELEFAARDVLADLDARGIDRFALGGCSMGGYVAMTILRIAPERVAGLVLVDTKAEADTEEAKANRRNIADRVDREGHGWMVETLPGLLGPNPPQQARELAERMMREQAAEDVAWGQRAMADRPDSKDLLARTTIPALVMVGEHDKLTSPQQSRTMAELLVNSTFVMIPDAGHLSPLEAPGAFTSWVSEWRARLA